MSNVYTYGIIENKIVELTEAHRFIVHGWLACEELEKLVKSGVPAQDIPQYFCGFCGSFVPLEKNTCCCGNLQRQ